MLCPTSPKHQLAVLPSPVLLIRFSKIPPNQTLLLFISRNVEFPV